jgi:soluble lytic murein transglycosylase-like protein
MTATKQEIIQLVRDRQQLLGLDPALVCAIIEQESDFNPWAIRYEPAFYDHYIVPLNLPSSTEAHARAFSFGLMQVMGECAREIQYLGPLAQLCDPETGIIIGCKWFTKKLAQAGGDQHRALFLWNGGGNEQYADQVEARISKYK